MLRSLHHFFFENKIEMKEKIGDLNGRFLDTHFICEYEGMIFYLERNHFFKKSFEKNSYVFLLLENRIVFFSKNFSV